GATVLPEAREIDRFSEAAWDAELGQAIHFASGGLAQYLPVYWFPALQRAVFSGGNTGPMVRNTETGQTTWFPKPVSAIRRAYAAAWPDFDEARLDLLTGWTSPYDAVPSPDGTLIAAAYGSAEKPAAGNWFGDFYYWTVVVLFDAATGTVIDAVVPLANRDFDFRSLDAYAPLVTEAPSRSMLAWAPGGAALYAWMFQMNGSGVDGAGVGSGRPRIIPLAAGSRSFVSPDDATELPARPLACPSGPVSRDGCALVLSTSGNTTAITIKDFDPGSLPAFVPFDAETSVSVPAFLDRYGGFRY
ncbi:MAG: hypothetical protein WCQ50_17295, partial [Spirochaetota bacterium]